MNSAKVRFQKQEQTTEKGRKVTVWVDFYHPWADLPALSVKEQTDIHNRSLTDAITLEVRSCNQVKEIISNLKDYQVIFEGKPYRLVGSDRSRKRQGWMRILAARTE